MNPKTSVLAIVSAAACLTCLTCLTALPAQAQVSATRGTQDLGKEIADKGAPGGVAACASCHGVRGEGNAATNFPRIAGQPAEYLARQLANYTNGSRANAIMMPIAKSLTKEQINAVSAYYAALAAPSPSPAAPPPAQQVKRGEVLANIGDEKIGVQSCANCHGPGGIGEPPLYPYLAGQHMGYLVAQLREWKNGNRKTDPSRQMELISKRLSDSDMEAVAAYHSVQPAPPPAALRDKIPARPAAQPKPRQ